MSVCPSWSAASECLSIFGLPYVARLPSFPASLCIRVVRDCPVLVITACTATIMLILCILALPIHVRARLSISRFALIHQTHSCMPRTCMHYCHCGHDATPCLLARAQRRVPVLRYTFTSSRHFSRRFHPSAALAMAARHILLLYSRSLARAYPLGVRDAHDFCLQLNIICFGGMLWRL